jgi:hypothetical protein
MAGASPGHDREENDLSVLSTAWKSLMHFRQQFKETRCWMPTNCFGHKLPPAFAC